MPKMKKIHRQHIHWKAEEDEKLISLVIKYNKRKWRNIAAEMGTRNAKQCRERYFGHLDGIDKHPLSKEEEALILKYRQSETDNGWARIAAIINDTFKTKRTANQIKNNYNQRLRKQLEILESQKFHEII
ncbi:unnamed protein product [Rhizophagus irregularis]|uniref:Homeodomain-like protein n=3 Tax=Rhizophagus irregularis TaxID=588596 RepID=A0A2I1G138_9GLOM|nr:Homeodomain-like protein [Rhizophagus irregularis DAOM 181602=DAOM 197198]EXX60386.1 hypothetical protein RirG_180340 [Rhizophagus irregularis DAOM 197198w]PKK70316.1 hypothetical protein RhiirC2_830344 [Rhizophagus irregularis]PKY40347.1 hypothetical protein RhiirA4_532067 [Rhizophagus irregularis]POG64999.1 Homeodomain-like protein [Rhizophagus irregularis DAOM 181602=DAOM 197198]UZO24912.1 hypothetical protein OCT59_017204 [Rhizophagus irregularis]|eukprot:XP_025171865.1 Homeodomain-like protein [Rhizophagus irregularis DAOM 181602=DAOM 197198]